jgi:hypothetical protein
VQPVDPIGEWQSPPFEPVVRGDNLFGRGAKFHLPNFFNGIATSIHFLIGLAGIGLGAFQGHPDAPFPLGALNDEVTS